MSVRPPFNPDALFKLTESPDPAWKFGQGLREESALAAEWIEQEKMGWKSLKTDEMDKSDVYRLLTSAITPRPIAFVSTISRDSVRNLSPFSYFSMIAHNPPIISVSFSLSPRRPKDTRENIKETKEFVVSIISEPFIEAANYSCVEAPRDVDEWIVSGLTPISSTVVKPPRVKESAVSLECELYDFKDIKALDSDQITTTLVLGLIKVIHVRHAVLTGDGVGAVDPAKLRAISRLGGTMYARVGEGFEIPRPPWKQVEEEMGREGDDV